MKIFAFSDWRTQSLSCLKDKIFEINPDLVIYSGDDLERVLPFTSALFLRMDRLLFDLDIVDFKSTFELLDGITENDLIEIFTFIKNKANSSKEKIFDKYPLLYVNGNDDRSFEFQGEYYFQIKGLSFYSKLGFAICFSPAPKGRITVSKNLDFRKFDNNAGGFYLKSKINPSFGHAKIKGLSVFGYQTKSGLEGKVLNRPKKRVDIFISHIPPLGFLDLSTRFGLNHTGSKEVSEDVVKFKPKYLICGHSHMWGGQTARINKTIIINTSSHDYINSPGNFAIIDTDKNEVKQDHIRFLNINQIRGGRSIFSQLKECGDFESINEIENINILTSRRDFYSLLKAKKIILDERIKNRIDSLSWEKPRVIKRLSFNPDKCIYIDVETGLANGKDPGKLWLIGVMFNGTINHFYYPKNKKDFKNFISENKNVPIVSWTAYDQKSIAKHYRLSNQWIDACQRVSNCIEWHSFKLGDLHTALLGKEESSPMGGLYLGLYADHRIHNTKPCRFCPDKNLIIKYAVDKNTRDLKQMYALCKYVAKI